ncbi:Exosome complex exonuclease rrp6 [Nosema granulosis]|uniref:Exosome complex exonuclease rrp6 n=1 Tax=Nosema granulosis TaxID=83296 RepID=A0A9P6GZN6_9MICR|nr:Exosome complex exonuclease rrp6 [Nosema granulosis]
MNKCDIAAEFLKKLNGLLVYMNQNKIQKDSKFDNIKQKIEIIKDMFKDSEKNVKERLQSIKIDKKIRNNIKYNFENEAITTITSNSIKKIKVESAVFDTKECNHTFKEIPIFNYHQTTYLKTKDQLNELSGSEYIVVDAFYHNYRSYNGFLCFLTVLDPFGTIYIIDALQFREKIIEMDLFGCRFKKIFISRGSYFKCLKDFKNINCFTVFENGLSTNLQDKMYVDWRIRPIDKYLIFLLQIDIVKNLNLLNGVFKIKSTRTKKIDDLTKKLETLDIKTTENIERKFYCVETMEECNKLTDKELERAVKKIEILFPFIDKIAKLINSKTINNEHIYVEEKEGFEFVDKSGKNKTLVVSKYIKSKFKAKKSPYLEQIIKHREHIAMENDESIFYILSNKKLVEITEKKPADYKSLAKILIDVSPLIKEDFQGFLYRKKRVNLKKSNKKIEKTVKKVQTKFSKNRDIRGNLFENPNAQWWRNKNSKDKFEYTEESTDYEMKIEKKKRGNKSKEIKEKKPRKKQTKLK